MKMTGVRDATMTSNNICDLARNKQQLKEQQLEENAAVVQVHMQDCGALGVQNNNSETAAGKDGNPNNSNKTPAATGRNATKRARMKPQERTRDNQKRSHRKLAGEQRKLEFKKEYCQRYKMFCSDLEKEAVMAEDWKLYQSWWHFARFNGELSWDLFFSWLDFRKRELKSRINIDDQIKVLEHDNKKKDDCLKAMEQDNKKKDDCLKVLEHDKKKKDDRLKALEQDNKLKEDRNKELEQANKQNDERIKELIQDNKYKDGRIKYLLTVALKGVQDRKRSAFSSPSSNAKKKLALFSKQTATDVPDKEGRVDRKTDKPTDILSNGNAKAHVIVPIGSRVLQCNRTVWYFGEVKTHNKDTSEYSVLFDDGCEEEMAESKLKEILCDEKDYFNCLDRYNMSTRWDRESNCTSFHFDYMEQIEFEPSSEQWKLMKFLYRIYGCEIWNSQRLSRATFRLGGMPKRDIEHAFKARFHLE